MPLPPPRISPPALPSARMVVPPPLPGERAGEFDPLAPVQSGRDQLFLGRGQKFGVWIAVNSTNVNRIKCDQDVGPNGQRLPTGTIYIEFLDLSLYQYPGRPLNDFLDLESSSSKGRYVYHVVRNGWAFTKLRGAQRSAAEVAAIAESRQPRNAQQARRFYNVGGRHQAGGGTPSPH